MTRQEFLEIVNQPNTVYNIDSEVQMGGGTITIPAGCTLNIIGGGYFTNEIATPATLNLNSATIIGDFNKLIVQGTGAINITNVKVGTYKFDTTTNKPSHWTGSDWKEGQQVGECYLKTETYSKTELNSMITTPNQGYVTVATYSALPGTGSSDTVYRVSNWDGSANSGAGAVDNTKYSEYAWDGSAYVFLSVKSQIGEVFDISGYNNDTYDDLADALGTNGQNVPESLRKGGMSIKYVSSSDNKYVQYRFLLSGSFTAAQFADTNNWSFCGDDVIMENPEYIYARTDKDGKLLVAIKKDGSIYWGAGVPQQVIDCVNEKIAELSLDEYEDIITFLGNLIDGDETLSDLLGEKVDKEEGKGLSTNDYSNGDKELVNMSSLVNNQEWIDVKTDSNGKILEGWKKEGTKFEFCDVKYPNGIPSEIQEKINEIPTPSSIDSSLSETSENPVQNKVITPYIQNNQMSNHRDMFYDESLDWIQNKYLEDKYWPSEQTTVESFIAKFSARAGTGKYQVAVISDTHGSGIGYTYSKSDPLSAGKTNVRNIAIFNKLMEYCDAGIHGGDLSCDYGTSRLRILEYSAAVLNRFKFDTSKPLFITKGNHDENNNSYVEADLLHLDWANKTYYRTHDGGQISESEWSGPKLYEYSPQLVSDREFRNICQHYHAPTNAVWGNGAYYYYDVDDFKIRFIIANSFPVNDEYVISESEEYLWLAQTALNFSDKNNASEWSVVMVRHTQATGISNLASCINAFRNGSSWTYSGTTVNFGSMNGGGMEFIAHIHGHEHHYVFSNGAGFFDIGETISCTKGIGNASTYGLSVWTIDTVSKKVYEDTIDGDTWIYNYDSGRMELHRGDTFECAESGLQRTVTASCSEPTITCTDMEVKIANNTPYGDYTIVVTGANGSTLNYLISVVE